MGRIGGGNRRGGDEVQVFGAQPCACRPAVGAHQGDRPVDHHRLGVGDPRLIIDPDLHAHVHQRADPARPPAGCRLIRDQSNVDATPLGPTASRLATARNARTASGSFLD